MLYLFQSWKESLSLFTPQNAKLFLWVTLKTIITSYKTFFKHFWWLLLLTVSLTYMQESPYFQALRESSPSMAQDAWIIIIFSLLTLFVWTATVFSMYLVIRPSLKPKGFNYYKGYIKKFFYFLVYTLFFTTMSITLVMLLTMFALTVVPSLLDSALFQNPNLLGTVLLGSLLMPLGYSFSYVAPLLSFTIFFMLDSDGSFISLFSSIWRSIKMAIYNYPFCLIAFAFFFCLFVGMAYVMNLLLGAYSFIYTLFISNVLLMIPLCILSTFYTKRIHDQFGLYYPETIKE